MTIILKVLATFIIGINGWIMCCGWISVFSQNLLFLDALMNLFQQNRSIVIFVVFLLSFLCTVISLVAFFWIIRKQKD